MTVRDREVLDLLRDEPELLAIADAVAETESSPRRFRSYRAPAAVALAAVAIFGLVLASPWDRGGGNGTILGRALAAIDSRGPVVHMTLRLDVPNGRSTVATETYYDKGRGLVRVVSRSGGRVLSDFTTAAVEDEFSVFPGLLEGAAFYRQALARGKATVVGRGTWEGRSIYWLELERGAGPGIFRVGIDRESYRPVVFRALNPNGTPSGFQLAVLGFEYVPASEARFEIEAPVLVIGTVLGSDCRPVKARVGVSLAKPDQLGAEVASARTGSNGGFTLRVDPQKSPFREASAGGRSLSFILEARGKAGQGFGYARFSRFVTNGQWEGATPLVVHLGTKTSC